MVVHATFLSQEAEAVAGGSESSEYRNIAVSGAEAVLEAPAPQSSAFAPHQVSTCNPAVGTQPPELQALRCFNHTWLVVTTARDPIS